MIFARIVVLLSVAAGLASCGSHEKSPSPPGVVEITYWRTLSGAAGDAQDELVARFNTSQSKVHVRAEYQGTYSDLATKLVTAAAARTGPEVTQLGTFEIRQFAKSGLLVDLKPLIEGADGIDRSDWIGTMASAGEIDDGIYWLPFNVAVPALYYNASAFEEAGIAGPPATWQDFFAAARKLTTRKADGSADRAGVALWSNTWPLFSMIWSEGGELTSRDYKNITLNDPVVVRLMTELQSLVREGAAILPDRASGGHRAAFVNGRAAMILDSQDAFDEVFTLATNFRPSVTTYPAGAQGRVYAPGGGGLAMFATAPNMKRDAAWSFVRFMLAPEQIAYYATRSGYAAYSASAQKAMGDILNDARYAAIQSALPHIRADFSVNMSPAVRTAFDEAFQKIVFQNADVQRTLDDADTKAEQAIKTEMAR